MGFTEGTTIWDDSGLPARQAAYRILNEIFYKRKNLDDAIAQSPTLETLQGRDRAFVRLLVALVLKRAREMDGILAKLLRDPIETLKPPQLINIFRLGIAQYLYLKTPAHAAVNTSVELAEAERIVHHKPLVNAVMRRLTREETETLPAREAGKINTPAWLWNAWMADYGVETALDIAAANLDEGAIDFTVKNDPEEWAQKLEATLLPTGSLRRAGGGFIPDLPGFVEGAWWIQNAAAAIPAKLFGDLRGKTVIDLCAAPGGKTAQLASMGAQVIALDRSAERIRRLSENMERLNLKVETVIADGSVWQPAELVDTVLLDAPCTATGTIRHQPDVLWLKEPKDEEKLAALQKRLLENAAFMLKPGGVLIYCTCSLQKSEGENQGAWALRKQFGLQPFPITEKDLPGIAEMITQEGELRCLPQHWAGQGGLDGFYIARFIKV